LSENRHKKIAIVGGDVGSGSNEQLRWDSFKWEQPSSTVNLHDYDVWVFQVISFRQEVPHKSLFASLNVDYVCEALHRDTQIFVFGDPCFNVRLPNLNKQFLEWSGYAFDWKRAAGDTIDIQLITDSMFDELYPYLRGLRRWNYSLRAIYPERSFNESKLGMPKGYGGPGYFFNPVHLAVNRHKEGICSALEFRQGGHTHGAIFLVPENEDSSIPAFHEFLRTTLGIEVQENAPTWVDSIVAPRQAPLDAEISRLQEEIDIARQHLTDAQHERDSIRACLEVLYQSGNALEQSVQTMLESLTGTLIQPPAKGEADRFLSVTFDGEEHKAVLEIKSTKNEQFNIKGLRQVKEWRDNYLMASGEEAKAIFIGNSDITTDPSKRPSPFPDQWVKSAEKFKVACITTPILYHAFELHVAGQLDTERFWKTLFTTDGIVNAHSLSIAELPPQSADVQARSGE